MKNEEKLGAVQLAFSLKYDTLLQLTDFTLEWKAKVIKYLKLSSLKKVW